MKTQHTPGPWIWNPEGDETVVRIPMPYPQDFSTLGASEVATVEDIANARLIAMAPAMLQALQRITHPAADDDDLEHALSVIAQATKVQP